MPQFLDVCLSVGSRWFVGDVEAGFAKAFEPMVDPVLVPDPDFNLIPGTVPELGVQLQYPGNRDMPILCITKLAIDRRQVDMEPKKIRIRPVLD